MLDVSSIERKNKSRRGKEDKYSLLDELHRRRENDPLSNFQLLPKQKEFFDAVIGNKYTESWYLGGNRSGKSQVGAYVDAKLARFGLPRTDTIKWSKGQGSEVAVRDFATSGWVVSLDFPSSRDIIQPKIFDNGFTPPGGEAPLIPNREIDSWNRSDQVLRLKNGSIIGFKSADSGQTKFYGAEKDYIHFDEPPPKMIYDECVIRVGSRKLRTFGTCTLLPPPGMVGGVSWLHGEKVRPWKEGKLPDIFIISASIYDNPFIPEDEIRKLENLYAEGSLNRQIRLLGLLVAGIAGDRVYSNFDPRLHVRNLDPISNFYNEFQPLNWLWDFNVNPFITLVVVHIDGVDYVLKELVLEPGSIGEMCEEFRKYFPYHPGGVTIFGDASGNSLSHQSKTSSYTMIINHMSDYPAAVRLKVPFSNPPIATRINSINNSFMDSKRTIRLVINSSCKELISDLEEVVTDGRGGIKKVTDKKDPYYKRTHSSDALGYYITMESPVIVGTGKRGQADKGIPRVCYGNSKKFRVWC